MKKGAVQAPFYIVYVKNLTFYKKFLFKKHSHKLLSRDVVEV